MRGWLYSRPSPDRCLRSGSLAKPPRVFFSLRSGGLVRHPSYSCWAAWVILLSRHSSSYGCAPVLPNKVLQPTGLPRLSLNVRQQVRQLDLAPPQSYTMHAHLIPSYYLERVVSTRTMTVG